MMWWCDDVVMWWWDGSHGLKIWGIGFYAKTTAPIDNATLTDTIFFSPTLKGGKLFIVSCEFWFFLYAKIFYYSYIFKGAKLAKFIRYEALWKLMWDEVRDTSISITKCTEMGWNDCVFERTEEHWKLWRCEVEIFFFMKRFFTMLCFVQKDTVLFFTYD